MKKNQLRLAVIGFGVMGRHHANVYAALPHVDLVAIVDPVEQRCQEARDLYDVHTYPTVTDMLEAGNIDAASLATPTSLHYHLAKQLIRTGIHLLVEKPVAVTVAQAQHLASLSQEHDVVLQVGHITRFYHSVKLLRERVSNPYLIEARRLSPNNRIKDIGVILDLMIHDIDIVLGLLPHTISHINVDAHNLNGDPFEDVAAAQILFDNGCIVRFLASRVAPDAERTLVIAEPHQTLRLDFGKEPHTQMSIYKPVKPFNSGHTSPSNNHIQVEQTKILEDNPLRQELEHFLARVRHDAEPIGTLKDDIRSLDLATKLIQKLKPQSVY